MSNYNNVPADLGIISAADNGDGSFSSYWLMLENSAVDMSPPSIQPAASLQDFVISDTDCYYLGGENNDCIYLGENGTPVNQDAFASEMVYLSISASITGPQLFLSDVDNQIYTYDPSDASHQPVDITGSETFGTIYSLKTRGDRLLVLHDSGQLSIYGEGENGLGWTTYTIPTLQNPNAIATWGIDESSPIYASDADTLGVLEFSGETPATLTFSPLLDLDESWNGLHDISGLKASESGASVSTEYLYFTTKAQGWVFCLFLSSEDYPDKKTFQYPTISTLSNGTPSRIFANTDGNIYYASGDENRTVMSIVPIWSPMYVYAGALSGMTALPSTGFVIAEQGGESSTFTYAEDVTSTFEGYEIVNETANIIDYTVPDGEATEKDYSNFNEDSEVTSPIPITGERGDHPVNLEISVLYGNGMYTAGGIVIIGEMDIDIGTLSQL